MDIARNPAAQAISGGRAGVWPLLLAAAAVAGVIVVALHTAVWMLTHSD